MDYTCHVCGAKTSQGPTRSLVRGCYYPSFCRRSECAPDLPLRSPATVTMHDGAPTKMERVNWAFERILAHRLGVAVGDIDLVQARAALISNHEVSKPI